MKTICTQCGKKALELKRITDRLATWRCQCGHEVIDYVKGGSKK